MRTGTTTRFFSSRQYVYAFHSPRARAIKIGCSAMPSERLPEVQMGHGCPLVLVAQLAGGFDKESHYHRVLADHRMHGEWFKACPEVWAVVEEMKEREAKRLASLEERRRKREEAKALNGSQEQSQAA